MLAKVACLRLWLIAIAKRDCPLKWGISVFIVNYGLAVILYNLRRWVEMIPVWCALNCDTCNEVLAGTWANSTYLPRARLVYEAKECGYVVLDSLVFCSKDCQNAYEPPSEDKPVWLP